MRLHRSQPATVTTQPDAPAPTFVCPLCRHHATYQLTVTGGPGLPDRWDYYECGPCDRFLLYRHRNRTLRFVRDLPRFNTTS